VFHLYHSGAKLNTEVLEKRPKNGDMNSITEDLALRWELPTALQRLPYSAGSITGINLITKTSIRDRIPVSRSC